MDLQLLNKTYQSLSFQGRLEKLFQEYPADKILFTSSFGTTSMALLHLLSKVKPGHPVHFIDTSYHFQETLDYRNKLIDHLRLKVIDVKAGKKRNEFTKENNTWKHNQDLCCFINKIEPLEEIKAQHSIWVSGVLGFQSPHRENLNLFEHKDGLVKFHPLIDMTKQDLNLYTQLFELPVHSLLQQGYDSVGCTHCTSKGTGRDGRWIDLPKTECGLHDTSLLIKKRVAS